MDNNSGNSGENQTPDPQEQPNPIYESVPVDETISPEEVSADVSSTDDAFSSAPPSEIPPDQPMYPSSGGGNRSRFLIVGLVVLFFIGILFIVLRILFGGSKPQQAPKDVKLTYWGLWEDSAIYDDVIKEYQKNNPHVTITYKKMTPEDYLIKLLTQSKNKVGPDIFRFHNTWLPQLREVVSPLPESIMSNQEFEKTFYPTHARDLKIDKYYYGIPLEIDGLVLIYNDSLFKLAGIDKPPVLWDDLIGSSDSYVNRLTIKDPDGKITQSGIALGTSSNIEHFSDIFGFMLLQNVLSQKDASKLSREEIWAILKNLNTPEARSIFQEYVSLSEAPDNVWDVDMPNSINAFIQQKVAMIIAPSWEVINIKSANFDIPVKVAPLPQVPQDPSVKPVNIAFGSYWAEGVSKFSENQLEAWKFLKYLSQKETLIKLYEKQKAQRLFGEPYPRVDMADLLIKDEYLGPVIQQANYYYSLPIASRTFDGGANHTGGMNDDIINYLNDAINKAVAGAGYTEPLKTAQSGIEQIYTKYKIQ